MELEPVTTIDQLLRRLATNHAETTLLSYPSEQQGNNVISYWDYTGTDLDALTKSVIETLPESLLGLSRKTRQYGLGKDGDCASDEVVAVVGISSFEYYINFLALQRLGITTMLVSPRLADQGFAHLIRETQCKVAIASGSAIEVLERVRDAAEHDVDFEILPMADLNTTIVQSHSAGKKLSNFEEQKPHEDGKTPTVIIHSGGTTGLPKPIRLSSGDWLLQAAALSTRMPQVDTLSTLPLFHSFGLATLFRCLVSAKRLALCDAGRPITTSSIMSGLEATQSKTLVTVPYILGFFTEVEGAVDRLARLTQVIAAGSAIPDHLSNVLRGGNVNIFHLYGQTESGALMEPCPDDWDWVVPLPHSQPFLEFEPVSVQSEGENLYHLIIRPGLKTQILSNRPDGSYATNDLFKRHVSDPLRWKFMTRFDNIIVLVNGEKADPSPLEEAVSSSQNVQHAIVFGQGRDSLGMVIIPSFSSRLSPDELLDDIKAKLELGNSRVPAYARISIDSVIVKEPETQVPLTDKGTVIRAMALKKLEDDIVKFYGLRESGVNGYKASSMEDILEAVLDAVKAGLSGKPDLDNETDLFSLSMDSLQASNVRARLLRTVDLGGQILGTNVVFDHPSVRLLTNHLVKVRCGEGFDGSEVKRPTKEVAQRLVSKYSQFQVVEKAVISRSHTEAQVVLLTGATGTIGTHILATLLKHPSVARVYCLVRIQSGVSQEDMNQAALQRIEASLSAARLTLSPCETFKISAVAAKLAEPGLGLDDFLYETLRTTVTKTIHGAWAVNFNMSLPSFEPSVASVFHLLNLAMLSPLQPKPSFVFISSIAAVLRAIPGPRGIEEKSHGWESVADLGYGQSKWAAEEICAAAASHCPDLNVRVVRVGQAAGDTQHGIWNVTEAIPSVIQSAWTVGALPVMEVGDDAMHWLPVDLAAQAIAELALQDDEEGAIDDSPTKQHSICHVSNALSLDWNAQFLPYLRSSGLQFDAVPQREWLRRLEASDPDVSLNPPYRLLDFFKQRYGTVRPVEDREPYLDVSVTGQKISWVTCGKKIDAEMVGRFLRYWAEKAGKNLVKVDQQLE